MVQIDKNQAVLSKTSSYDIEKLKDIHPRLCTLHKWPHYDGYGIHLTCNENWCGLYIDDIEPNSPAESAGLLPEDIILAVNGRSIENEDFFVILTLIQDALEQDQIRFLVLDPYSAELAQRDQINIDENYENCIRKETPKFMESSIKFNQTMAHNSSNETLDDMNKVPGSNNNCKSEPRMCSMTLRPGGEPIGISLQSDTDFSHIITQVKSNSPAARAGIEQDDCILFLNNTSLLHIAFEDVLYFLAKSRNDPKLNFLVAKKSYLLQSSQNHLTSKTCDQLVSSIHLIERNRSSTLPAIETSKQTDSKSIYKHLHVAKHKKRHGKILEGIGPATALRSSWSVTSEKTIDYSSIRSDLSNRRIDMDEIKDRRSIMKDTFNSLQVGMTNPSPKQRPRRISTYLPSVSFSDDGQRAAQSESSVRRLYHSSKPVPNSNLAMKRNHIFNTPSPLIKHNRTIQNTLYAVPIKPIQSLPTLYVGEQGLSNV